MTATENATLALLDTPIGPLLLESDGAALTAIRFCDGPPAPPPAAPTTAPPGPAGAVLDRAADQLRAYFAGTRSEFDLPLGPGGTPFQRRVWAGLTEIPYGETWSYGELARRIGTAAGPRAVGAANGQNPLPIVVPCHRVVGANGKLVGYGGGLDRKRILLELEARVRVTRDFGAVTR